MSALFAAAVFVLLAFLIVTGLVGLLWMARSVWVEIFKMLRGR